MVFTAIFYSGYISRRLVQLSLLSLSSYNQYSAQYSFQITGCFPSWPLSKHWTPVREEWYLVAIMDYHQSPERMVAESGIEPATSYSQVRHATDWNMGLGPPPFHLFPNDTSWTLPNWNSLQTTISNLKWRRVVRTHDLVGVSSIHGWGELSFRHIFSFHLCRSILLTSTSHNIPSH